MQKHTETRGRPPLVGIVGNSNVGNPVCDRLLTDRNNSGSTMQEVMSTQKIQHSSP